jgi:hypothetical protein
MPDASASTQARNPKVELAAWAPPLVKRPQRERRSDGLVTNRVDLPIIEDAAITAIARERGWTKMTTLRVAVREFIERND